MASNQEEEMDLNDWEFLLSPRQFDSRFLDHSYVDGDFVVVSPISKTSIQDAFGTNFFLNMDHFIPSSVSNPHIVGGVSPPNQLISGQILSFVKGYREISTCSEVSVAEVETIETSPNLGLLDDRNVHPHHVSFNKETEFVDMKLDLDSPKLSTVSAIISQQVMNPFVPFDHGIEIATNTEIVCSSAESVDALEKCIRHVEVSDADSKKESSIEWGKQENNQWWIGPLCSLGIAATSICVLFVVGAHHHHHHAINKRIKEQMVSPNRAG